MSSSSTLALAELRDGPLYRFADWPNPEVPNGRIGVYTVWGGDELIYWAAAAWNTRPYFRILTARATTRIPTTTEIASSAIIMSFAHGFIAETSVGLNAIEVLKDRCR